MAIPKLPARRLGGPVFLLLLLQAVPAHSESLDQLAEKLVNLRGEVEELNSELKSLREQHKNEMGSLSRRKSQLESTIQKREVSLDELRTSLQEKRKKARQAGVEEKALKPVVTDAIADLKTRIRRGLPFKVDKRLGELGEIEKQLASGVLTPHKATKQLWSFYEDEVRLSEGSGVYQQTVEVDGEARLADVARIGMVMMYFRTPDQRYGRVVREGGEWRYQVIHETAAKNRVKELFASFRKQIRTGYFVVPNALTGMEDL
jgi:archaellum component FlaC